ncbi:lipopolysaccharide assembly protein LapA domain-containing protein [Lutibaculum baratangense]|uniref:Lipopolysaccharide assembly protein A domain-containing protein n=1 Tax=Lutibaculum baratangense AMV1 TaxID=631454 RepID=V4RIL8_9HYPH|nr:lipopolysaccharide assembly protein LapA domain-containing protein [Lutibaculum baratangense]ESR25931.1 hypothetical protein N177_1266 [Lutibaculum baratangense AMV1]
MGRILQLVVLVPLAVILIVFAVSNRHPVLVSLDPFSPEDPSLALDLPLYLLLFGTLLLGVLVGGIAAWVSQGRWRSEARTRRAEARRWKARASEIEAQTATSPAGPGLPAPTAGR